MAYRMTEEPTPEELRAAVMRSWFLEIEQKGARTREIAKMALGVAAFALVVAIAAFIGHYL
jgi:hypothetical protein